MLIDSSGHAHVGDVIGPASASDLASGFMNEWRLRCGLGLALPAGAVTSLRICLRSPLLHVLNGGGRSSRIVATESIKPATLAILTFFQGYKVRISV